MLDVEKIADEEYDNERFQKYHLIHLIICDLFGNWNICKK